ncbi:LysE family translocator [Halapricum hydrolyticum]|uniref:LysE family translocator n=1 Tax=Halapricum hydrolyticum TaxID=2979991 RepID=A0AAE3LE33_9EURY|nr:LysE family translocator [Halapricum hydrolyticum]MCU4716935.1 LysE family translocator [Halapricum hydrolyticum]MCU4725460.1 LysE family translocator [Halapricum hydrolyticum]
MSLFEVVATAGAGVVFGLALAAPPGPMNAVIAEESVVRGWRAGFTAGLGAMVADACFLALSLLGAVTIVQRSPTLRGVMVGIGGLLLWYFAYDAVRDLSVTFQSEGAATNGHGFLKAFTLAITNPYQIVFWLTVGVGLLDSGRIDVLATALSPESPLAGHLIVRTGTPLLIAGLFAGIVVWIVSFPAALVAGRERVDRFAPAVATLSAIAFAGFGVLFVFDAASTLL